MKKSELRNIIREEIKRLQESGFTMSKLEDQWYSNHKKIKQNMKTYGYRTAKDVAKIKNPYDLADVLGVDSREFKGWDQNSVSEFADYLAGLIQQGA